MKVSRISFPDSSPDHPEADGRTYLDMVAGVLNVVTTEGKAPIGPLVITTSAASNTPINLASVGQYIRITSNVANTATIADNAAGFPYLVGSVIEIKNVGSDTTTITAGSGDVTLVGTAALTTGKAAKLICIASAASTCTWEILAYA